jgi:predicted nucleic acid-binding protein
VAYTSDIAIALFCEVVQLYLATDLNSMNSRKSYALIITTSLSVAAALTAVAAIFIV